jgi:hypothetical protein
MCTVSSSSVAAKCDTSANPAMMYGTAYLLIMVEGLSVDDTSAVALLDSNAVESGAAEQYFDPKCNVHQNTTIEACEHPGQIVSMFTSLSGTTSPFTNTYKCLHGNCQIGIDK